MRKRSVLSGDLEFVPLADLFQILGGGNSTGVLLINGEFSPCKGEIHFASGEPVDAAWGSHQGLNAVYALFGWAQGRFEFRRQRFSGSRRIKKGRMEIVLDAMRMLDDGLIKRVGVPQEPNPNLPRPSYRLEDDLSTITGPMIDYDYILYEERFRPGKKIVSEGLYGNWVWAMLEGTALVSRQKEGINNSLFFLGEGAFIGSIDVLLFGDHVRTATVTATSDVHSAILDSHRLGSELTSVSPEFRSYLVRLPDKVKEVTDELIGLIGVKEKRRSKGPAREDHGGFPTLPSNLTTAYGREYIELEKFQDEYAGLSRTFKSLIQCTVNSISTLTRKASEVKGLLPAQ